MGFVDDFLTENKIYPNIDGYDFLIDAVQEVVSGEKKLMSVYANVSKKHKVTPSRVEHAIRYLIDTRIDGKIIQGHICNGEFIFYLARKQKK